MSNILRIPPRPRLPPTAAKMDLDVPQITTINQVGPMSSEADFDYLTDDEEIDEIIDDEPIHAPAVSALPSSHKVNNKGKAKATPTDLTPSVTPTLVEPPKPKPATEIPPLPSRKPGETYIDQQRVEKIIKAHGDMLPPSKDAVFLISLAAEEFIKDLAQAGRRHADIDNRKGILQRDIAATANNLQNFSFLKETVPMAIPLSVALQKHAQKENERTLIATEHVPPSPSIGNGTTANSHKKRQPPLPKPQPPTKGKTRTSARQANGRGASTSASAPAPAPVTSAPSRPKRAAAQKGRVSWNPPDEPEAPEYKKGELDGPDVAREPTLVPMDVDMNGHWKGSSKPTFGGSGGKGGIMKGFGPGAYGKGGLGGARSVSATGHGLPTSRSKTPWGFPPEPPRNTGRTIYSDRTDEEARKAAVEAEEELRYKRARQRLEQDYLLDAEILDDEPPIDGGREGV